MIRKHTLFYLLQKVSVFEIYAFVFEHIRPLSCHSIRRKTLNDNDLNAKALFL